MMDEKTKIDEVKFPLNVKLLEETSKISLERKVIRERIKKIEASKGEVSETVYQKVRNDYIEQLNRNTDQLLEKKQDIDRELSTLLEAKKKVEANVSGHKERLEEINFRHSLGEYKEEEFHKLSDEENEKLGKFEKILAAINVNIKKYEELFEGEDDFFESPKFEETPLPPKPPKETPIEAPISMEEEYQLGGGEGYFEQVMDESEPNSPERYEVTESATPIEPLQISKTTPKLTIMEGDRQGETFELKEEETTIGRASSNTIILKEAKVSRQHASIKKKGNEYLIEDIHSSNGVFVNDEKITEHALSNGDIIRIGDFILKFSR